MLEDLNIIIIIIWESKLVNKLRNFIGIGVELHAHIFFEIGRLLACVFQHATYSSARRTDIL